MNGPIEQTIRKFNPGTFQPDEEVIRQFVVRKCELDIVLEILRGNIDSPSCEHVLLVAPRGRGKTTLLARVASELRTDTELSGQLFPIRFMEESQEIFNLADFWLETLFYLARESTERDPDLSRELKDTHAGLAGEWRGENLEERARAAVLEAADRIGMKLVLMVENLQALCESVDDDFGWKLRGALQSEPQVMLLATATSRFKGLDDAREPFFELFRVLRLEPLDTEQCRSLWQMVTRDAVTGREIRPLQILTGGNPRLLIIIADFARHRSLRELMEDLVSLIDDHTEYFRAHLEGFAKTERRVYLAVIDLWRPSTTGEIAARARMDVRAVSALLGRLVERGAVVVEGSGRKRMYAASERLYSIYYKLRRERDEAAVVRSLIHFMAAFYREAELAEISRKLKVEASRSPGIREGFEQAATEMPQIANLFPGMPRPDIEQAPKPAATIGNGRAKQLLGAILDEGNKGRFEKVLELTSQILASQDTSSTQGSELLVATTLFLQAVAYSELGDSEAAIAAYSDVVGRFGAVDFPEIQVLIARSMVNKGLEREQTGEVGRAITAYDEVVERFENNDIPDIKVQVATALINKGNVEERLGEVEAAIAIYDEVVERFGSSDLPELLAQVATALVDKIVAQGQLGESKGVLATCDQVIERFGEREAPALLVQVARALVSKAIAEALLVGAEAAISTCDEAIERFADSDVPRLQIQAATTMVIKSEAQIQLGRSEEALHTCNELERKFNALLDNDAIAFGWRANWIRTKVLLVQGKRSAAMGAFRSVYAAFVPGNEMMMAEMLGRMIDLVADLIATGASERTLVEILSSDEKKSAALAPFAIALRHGAGEAIREPAELVEVATDILEAIRRRIESKESSDGTASPGATT